MDETHDSGSEDGGAENATPRPGPWADPQTPPGYGPPPWASSQEPVPPGPAGGGFGLPPRTDFPGAAPSPWAAGWGGSGGGGFPPSGPGGASFPPPGPTGWGGVPSGQDPYWTPQPPRRSSISVAVTAILVAVAVIAGIGIGSALPRSTDSVSAGSSVPSGNGETPNGTVAPSSPTTGGTGQGGPANVPSIAAKVDPGLVDIDTQLGYQDEAAAGTGIVLNSDGLVLTNNHVINGSTAIRATDLGNGKVYKVTVVGYDESSDVAVVQLLGASGLKTADLAGSGTASVGQKVVAIGNAGGRGGQPSAAGGAVTALDQSITATDSGDGTSEKLKGLIQTNADVQPGDSGGSLVDTDGTVIGVDTAAEEGFSFSGGSGTEGYAIPIATAVGLARQIIAKTGSTTIHIGPTAFLGVKFEAATSGGLGNAVYGVVGGTAAKQAGIVVGDVITSFGGRKITTPEDLTQALVMYHPGNQVQVAWRTPAPAGLSRSAEVTLTMGPNA